MILGLITYIYITIEMNVSNAVDNRFLIELYKILWVMIEIIKLRSTKIIQNLTPMRRVSFTENLIFINGLSKQKFLLKCIDKMLN